MSVPFNIAGSLDEILLTDVLRFITLARQTGLLGLSTTGVKGAIYFHKGKIVDIESHEQSGMNALDQLAIFTDGHFEWHDQVTPLNRRLKDQPTEELIKTLEAKILEVRMMLDVSPTALEPKGRGGAAVPDDFQFGPKPTSTMSKLIDGVQSMFWRESQDLSGKKKDPKATSDARPQAPPIAFNTTKPLASFKAQELVQIFCLNGRSVKLGIVSEAGLQGGIFIWRGRVHHAAFGTQEGDEAFYTIVLMQKPDLIIQDISEEPPVTVSCPWDHLLMEAAMRRDMENLGAGEQGAPPPSG